MDPCDNLNQKSRILDSKEEDSQMKVEDEYN